MRNTQYEIAADDRDTAAVRAAAFLSVMLKYDLIPECHVEQAREIISAYESAKKRVDIALSIPSRQREVA